jgi:environmental stress-induced protein Ves
MPWANGGGVSYEVARFPEMGDFDWRVSLADISEDGPFSLLPGIDRTLVVVSGGPVALFEQLSSPQVGPDGSCEGTQTIESLPLKHLRNFEPWQFAGEQSLYCSLACENVQDLNVMTRRETCTSKVRIHDASTRIDVDHRDSRDVTIVIGLTGVIQIHELHLEPREAVFINDAQEIHASGMCAVIDISYM